MSYIISDGELIAKTQIDYSGGRSVRFSTTTASDGYSLVNAASGKISNAKKWDKVYKKSCNVLTAECLRDDGVNLDFKI